MLTHFLGTPRPRDPPIRGVLSVNAILILVLGKVARLTLRCRLRPRVAAGCASPLLNPFTLRRAPSRR